MFHLALYDGTVAAGTALVQIAAVSDVVVAPAGSGFLVPLLNRIARVYVVGPTPAGTLKDYAQLTSASLRTYTPFDIAPINVGELLETPTRFLDFDDTPIPVSTDEELDAFGVNSNAGGGRMTVAVMFCDGPITAVRGRFFTVHWTGSTTLTVNGWTSVVITLDNGIPSGTFAIVGSRMFSAGALFHRWIPRGGPAYRPGGPAVQAMDTYPQTRERYGKMGEWMRFTNTTPPQCEVFSRSADTVEQGWLDLLQVA